MQIGLEALKEVLERLPEDSAQRMIEALYAHRRVFVQGAGRSGLMIRAFAMRLAQAGYTVYAVGDVTTPAIGAGDLLLVASASGETAGVVRVAEVARAVGATVFALTAKECSSLTALADYSICFSAPTKNETGAGGVMGTLFEQAILLFGDAVIEELCVDAAEMRARHANLE
jgi:6-phospho-3-hexuloisomerase